MVQIVGEYDLVDNSSEVENYLKDSGYGEQFAERVVKTRTVVTVTEDDGKWTIKTLTDGIETIATSRLGEVYDDVMPHGGIVKSVTTRKGDTFTTESTLPDGRKAIRAYEFTEDGIVSTVGMENGPKATRIYKRLK